MEAGVKGPRLEDAVLRVSRRAQYFWGELGSSSKRNFQAHLPSIGYSHVSSKSLVVFDSLTQNQELFESKCKEL